MTKIIGGKYSKPILCPMQFDVKELLEVLRQMKRADELNKTSFAQDQEKYITDNYPDIVLN